MRFFRFMAITVLLLACVVLGSACAGAKGEQGPKGATGPQGPKGDTGLPGAGIAWEHEWGNSIAYGINDAVEYQGSSYISKQNGNTNHVPTDTGWWDFWIAKGDTGEQGIQGVQGTQGIQGPAGPNMIVAMGVVGQDGSLLQGYNVTSSELDSNVPAYRITLTGINYNHLSYVTMVTPVGPFLYADYYSYAGDLTVYVCNSSGATVAGFSFVILQVP
jgi:hypothetical protein